MEKIFNAIRKLTGTRERPKQNPLSEESALQMRLQEEAEASQGFRPPVTLPQADLEKSRNRLAEDLRRNDPNAMLNS